MKFFQTATLSFRGKLTKLFARLDGNHRLSASKEQQVRDRVTPFCLILCQNRVEYSRFSRALFHSINYKQVPLTMEHNLKLILEDVELFPDALLQQDPSFGWPYYHTRKLHGKLDLDLLPNLAPFLKDEPRTFLLRQFEFLIARGVLNDNANAIKRFKEALARLTHFSRHHLHSKNRRIAVCWRPLSTTNSRKMRRLPLSFAGFLKTTFSLLKTLAHRT